MCEDPSPKKRKMGQMIKLSSIILECRSVRIGTLRRMVTKPVVVRSTKNLISPAGSGIDICNFFILNYLVLLVNEHLYYSVSYAADA